MRFIAARLTLMHGPTSPHGLWPEEMVLWFRELCVQCCQPPNLRSQLGLSTVLKGGSQMMCPSLWPLGSDCGFRCSFKNLRKGLFKILAKMVRLPLNLCAFTVKEKLCQVLMVSSCHPHAVITTTLTYTRFIRFCAAWTVFYALALLEPSPRPTRRMVLGEGKWFPRRTDAFLSSANTFISTFSLSLQLLL